MKVTYYFKDAQNNNASYFWYFSLLLVESLCDLWHCECWGTDTSSQSETQEQQEIEMECHRQCWANPTRWELIGWFVKASQMGHFVMVSLWCASLDFAFFI